jgi:hypothetical protein
MAARIGDLGIGKGLEGGVEPVAAAGQHSDLDAVPPQFERLDDPGRAGADHQHRAGVRSRRQGLEDHRLTPSGRVVSHPAGERKRAAWNT